MLRHQNYNAFSSTDSSLNKDKSETDSWAERARAFAHASCGARLIDDRDFSGNLTLLFLVIAKCSDSI
jgi:hypothetical protein